MEEQDIEEIYVLGNEVGLNTPCLQGQWKGEYECKGIRETAGEAVSGKVPEVILGYGLIRLISDIPNGIQVEHTVSKGTTQ